MSTNNYPPPRSHRLLRLLALFTTITLLLLSCSKDEIRNQSSVSFDPKFKPYYRLLSFWEKTQNQIPKYPALIPRSDYSDTDIRDYIEGTLNMVYTDNNLTWEDYDRNTEYYSISLTSGYAQEEDVFDKYDEVVEEAAAYFYSIEEEDKFPYIFDVAITSTSLSSLQFSITSIIGKYHRDPTPFGSSDWWDVRVEEGHCAPMSGGTGNASDQICNALNDYYTPYYCHSWIDVVEVDIDAVDDPELLDYGWLDVNGNDPNQGDYIIDYRTFYAKCNTQNSECDELVDNGVFCLAPNEMNYYFQQVVGVYNAYYAATNLLPKYSAWGFITTYSSPDEIYSWTGGSTMFGNPVPCDEGEDFPYALPQPPG